MRVTRHRNPESGQSLALVAVGMIALVGILGLAVDMGYLRYVHREMQSAADAAAIAGAIDVTYGTWNSAGLGAASENGFPNGGGTTVTMSNPPSTGPYAGSSYPTYVQATITKTGVPTFFSKIFGVNNVTLSASSVAAGGTNCIYGLDTGAGGAININFSIVNSSCGVVDNANLTGTAAGLCAPSIQLVGSNNIIFGGTCGSGFRAAKPVKITSAVADPFAGLPKPGVLAPPACPGTGNPGSQTITVTSTISQVPIFCGGTIVNAPGQTVTFNPGTYFGSTAGQPAIQILSGNVVFNPGTYYIESRTAGTYGIQIAANGSNNTHVSFGSGTYTVYGGITDCCSFGSAVNWNSTASSPTMIILDGGGLRLIGNSGSSGSASTSTGGVTFFNTGTAAAGTPTTYGPIISLFDFNGFCGGSCQLQAPTTGTYAGILYFQDSNNTATVSCGFGSATANACFNGNINFRNQISQAGAYYFPGAKVAFNFDFGNGAPYSFLVANDISWFLTFTFNRNYANLPNGSPVKQGSATLVQ
ncbi:MAG TPA: pilus assembly protein TadG-related protein [Candidatus Acidoferrales bacterium]|nr:pilus assembly protein TadG-related protein [Candidatus Acidoferrales bacterium]